MHRIVVPNFQPIVDMQTGAVSHYEALARMRDGSSRHVALIQAGEACGFIHLVDRAITEAALQELRKRHCIRIAVNVSIQTMEHAPGDIVELLFRFQDVADRLVVEITETLNIRHFGKVELFVQALRLLKVQLAIDDFCDNGGFHTKELVARLRPDYVKLAEGVFNDLVVTHDPGALQEVKKIAESIGAQLIAEHIDSEEKVRLLREHGVRYGQGFYFGRGEPVPHGNEVWCRNVGKSCENVCQRHPVGARIFPVSSGVVRTVAGGVK